MLTSSTILCLGYHTSRDTFHPPKSTFHLYIILIFPFLHSKYASFNFPLPQIRLSQLLPTSLYLKYAYFNFFQLPFTSNTLISTYFNFPLPQIRLFQLISTSFYLKYAYPNFPLPQIRLFQLISTSFYLKYAYPNFSQLPFTSNTAYSTSLYLKYGLFYLPLPQIPLIPPPFTSNTAYSNLPLLQTFRRNDPLRRKE